MGPGFNLKTSKTLPILLQQTPGVEFRLFKLYFGSTDYYKIFPKRLNQLLKRSRH